MVSSSARYCNSRTLSLYEYDSCDGDRLRCGQYTKPRQCAEAPRLRGTLRRTSKRHRIGISSHFSRRRSIWKCNGRSKPKRRHRRRTKEVSPSKSPLSRHLHRPANAFRRKRRKSTCENRLFFKKHHLFSISILDTPGLGLIPATIKRFEFDDVEHPPPVPHMGWNGLKPTQNQRYYFVHSYAAFVDDVPVEWTLATTEYGKRRFVSVVRRGNILATQFHPEKSGSVGLDLIRRFVEGVVMTSSSTSSSSMGLSMRVIACLDVRSNDDGDLVVTKGDHYDVRERKTTGCVRNLGKPVDLAARYYKEGADEITFLNITSFRGCPIRDQPMLDVLRQASENVFVPLTVGGGIRDVEYVDESGTSQHYSALEIATEYFKSGADKVSIGSDAVFAAQAFLASGRTKTGKTSIELIAKAYGRQASA